MRRETSALAAEDLGLDLVDVVLQAVRDGPVVVHDPVHDRVEDGLGPPPQQVGVALQPPPHLAQVRRLAVAHGDDEVRADEDVRLAELDRLGLVDVARRPEHDEERVAVALELRPLVGVERVLHRELVQPELLRPRSRTPPRVGL